jgi:hypothetical protein
VASRPFGTAPGDRCGEVVAETVAAAPEPDAEDCVAVWLPPQALVAIPATNSRADRRFNLSALARIVIRLLDIDAMRSQLPLPFRIGNVA